MDVVTWAKMSAPNSRQNETAKQILWNNSKFAAAYKIAEGFTGGYAYDLCLQMGIQSYGAPIHFLDLACGTGIVIRKALAMLQSAQPTRPSPDDKFTFADFSPEVLKVARSRVVSENWPISEEAKNMEVVEADMTDTKLPSDTYTHVGCNFGPGNAPNPDRTLGECYRMLRPGGVAGWTQWQSCGWLPDLTKAIRKIRESAARKCAEGNGTEEDQKLSKLPDVVSFEGMIAGFTGVNHDKLRADGVAEDRLPRWEKEDWFGTRVEKAGFVDVKISVVKKDSKISVEDAYSMIQPLIGIMSTFWTEQERKDALGADLQGRIKAWFDQYLDVEDGEVQSWGGWQAMVVTAKKPQ